MSSANSSTRAPDTTPKTSLLTRQMISFLLFSVAAYSCFAMLLSVVPLFANSTHDSSFAAGLAMGTMMLGTVITELWTHQILARFGYRLSMGMAVILLATPALVLIWSSALVTIVLTSLVRGAGLAILVVAGSAIAAELAPPNRRGESIGLYGIAASVPSIIGLPAGIWLSEHAGFNQVFLLSTGLGLLALFWLRALPTHRPAVSDQGSVLSALRDSRLARPTLIFLTTALASGIFVTFLPLAVGEDLRGVATLALLAQTSATAITRWGAGRLGDHFGATHLLLPAMLLCAAGAAAVIATTTPPMVIAGMTLFGIGFGIAQTSTISMLFERVPISEFGRVSALWNMAFDAGMGSARLGSALSPVALAIREDSPS
ncbi:MAG: MFS transporter [Thermomicrobiales bacterium]